MLLQNRVGLLKLTQKPKTPRPQTGGFFFVSCKIEAGFASHESTLASHERTTGQEVDFSDQAATPPLPTAAEIRIEIQDAKRQTGKRQRAAPRRHITSYLIRLRFRFSFFSIHFFKGSDCPSTDTQLLRYCQLI